MDNQLAVPGDGYRYPVEGTNPSPMMPTYDLTSESLRNVRNYDRGLMTEQELINNIIELLAFHTATAMQIADCLTQLPIRHHGATRLLLQQFKDGRLLMTTSTGDHRTRDEIVADAERRAPGIRRIADIALSIPPLAQEDNG